MGKHVKKLIPKSLSTWWAFLMFFFFFTFQEKCCILPNLIIIIPNINHDCLDLFGLLDYSLRYYKKYLVLTLVCCFIQYFFSPPAFYLPSQLGRNWFTNLLICEALRFLTNIPKTWDSGCRWNKNKKIPQTY